MRAIIVLAAAAVAALTALIVAQLLLLATGLKITVLIPMSVSETEKRVGGGLLSRGGVGAGVKTLTSNQP